MSSRAEIEQVVGGVTNATPGAEQPAAFIPPSAKKERAAARSAQHFAKADRGSLLAQKGQGKPHRAFAGMIAGDVGELPLEDARSQKDRKQPHAK